MFKKANKEKKSFIIGFGFFLLAWLSVIFGLSRYLLDLRMLYFWMGVLCFGGLLNLIVVSKNDWMMPYKLKGDSFKIAQWLTNNFLSGDYRWGHDHPTYGQLLLSSKIIRFPLLADIFPISGCIYSIGDLIIHFSIIMLLIEIGVIIAIYI